MSVIGMCVNVRLKVIGDGKIDTAVSGVNGPSGRQSRTRKGTDFDRSVARPDIQAIKAAFDADVSVAGGSVDLAVETVRFDMAVSSAKADLAFGASEPDVAISCMNIHVAVDALDIHTTVSGLHLKIGIGGHADFNLERTVDVDAE